MVQKGLDALRGRAWPDSDLDEAAQERARLQTLLSAQVRGGGGGNKKGGGGGGRVPSGFRRRRKITELSLVTIALDKAGQMI